MSPMWTAVVLIWVSVWTKTWLTPDANELKLFWLHFWKGADVWSYPRVALEIRVTIPNEWFRFFLNSQIDGLPLGKKDQNCCPAYWLNLFYFFVE